MATKTELIDASIALRNQIYALSQNGAYSAAQREGFARLHVYFHFTVERFTFYPAHGDASAYYDAPLAAVQAAFALGLLCTPASVPSQQAYYDAVNRAATAIKEVTTKAQPSLKKVPKG